MSKTPTMQDVLKSAASGATAKMHTTLICCVVSYDEVSQTATLKSCSTFKYKDGDEIVSYDPPLLSNVPIMFPSSKIGGQVFSIVYPISEGDEAVVFFNERSIDEWKTGGSGSSSPRRFDMSDAVAYVGIRPPSNPLDSDSYQADAAVIRAPKLVVKCDDLLLGGPTASDFVALSSLVESEIAALWSAVNTHIHTGVTVGGGVTGPSSSSGSGGSVASTKVKSL